MRSFAAADGARGREWPGNVVYALLVRRIQLYLDDDVDDALTAQAAKLGTTRSALVRDAVSASLGSDPHAGSDPLDDVVGSLDVEPDEDIDSVIYGLDE